MPLDLPAAPPRQADLPLPVSTGKRPMREMGELDRHRVSQLIVNEDGGATYGSAKIFGGVCGADGRYRGGRWIIAIDGVARSRLKNWIRGLRDQGAGSDLVITRTREVDRSLRVFDLEFPLRIPSEDRQAMQEGADEAAESQRLARRIQLPGYVATNYELVGVTPYPFQRAGADALRASMGLLCADDLGLGKTILALCTLCDAALRPALVVCPPSLIRQWVAEINRCLPQLRVHVLKGTQPYDYSAKWYDQAKRAHNGAQRRKGGRPQPFPYAGPMHPDVLVSTYDRLDGWADTLAGKVRYIIADEVHELRTGEETARYRAFQRIREAADACLGLSATPIFNYGGEAFKVLNAIAPGALGTEGEFAQSFCDGGSKHNAVSDPHGLHQELIARGLMIRRRRYEVGKELPKLTKAPVPIPADLDVFKRETKAGGAVDLARFIVANSGAEDAKLRAEAFTRGGVFERVMRQATGIAKAAAVTDLIRLCVSQGERPVVFCHHRAVWRIITEKLNEAGISFALYTGQETEKQKAEALADFCRTDGPSVMLLGLRAGSAGLDGLQHWSSTVIFGELDYTDAVHRQAEGRLHRNGQLLPVIAYYALADFGWDPIAVDIVGAKRAQAEGIFDPGGRQDAAETDLARPTSLAKAYLASIDKHPEGAAAKSKPYVHPG